MKRILLFLSLLLALTACNSGNTLEKVLSPEDLDYARKLTNEVYVYIHNRVAMEGVTEKPQIIERYFSNGLRISESLGSMDTLVPDNGFVRMFTQAYGIDGLSHFVDYDPETRRLVIKKDGQYMKVLARMSHRNKFFKGFYKFVKDSDGCTGLPYIVAINYRNIDFSKEDEQFIAYLALLTRPDDGQVRFSK